MLFYVTEKDQGRDNPSIGSRCLMPSLPIMSGSEVARTFEKLGWQMARQRGCHIIMVKEGLPVTLSIPNHKEVAKGALRSRSANLTADQFLSAR